MDLPAEQTAQVSMAAELDERARLLVAAEKLFAQYGLAATSVRDLAREAGVNVAAVNYYFGSKENLYVEMLRHTFRKLREEMPRYEALLRNAQTAGTKEAARQAIRLYIDDYMHSILGCDVTDRHMSLMAREMNDPTAALDTVIDEFIAPKARILRALIAQLRPDLADKQDLHFHAASIVGQCLHYRMTLPVTLKLLKRKRMTPELLQQVSNHIANFSLRALEAGGRA